MNIERVDEWLEDVASVCCNQHIVEEVRRVHFADGAYVKMCRRCYEQAYPAFQYDELEVCS